MSESVSRVLVTDRFDVDALAYLRTHKNLIIQSSAGPAPTAEELANIEGLIIRSRTRVDAELLHNAPKLKVIVTATSGFDHIDLAATQARGLAVMYTPNANAASAAEMTWALVLACARRVPNAHRSVKTGEWRRDALIGSQLEGKTYGVVGLGRIGGRVARIAGAFGMNVISHDPYLDSTNSQIGLSHINNFSLEELLRLSDVISFHVPKTKETEKMMGSAQFEAVNRGAILVNTARGSILSETDLILALKKGWLGAVGLDVFEHEPLSQQSPLLAFPNVILSPHLGATTHEAFARASREAAEKVVVFLSAGESLELDKKTSDRLPPEAPWYF